MTQNLIPLTISCIVALPIALGANIDVTIGGPGVLKYSPEFVNANPGDVVRFVFKQKNHTVTQSTFENPCVRALNGFHSGFLPVADTQTNGFPVAILTVADTSPVWVFCAQGNHCQQGMVFAINPGDEFPAFQAAASGGAPPLSTSSTSPTFSSTSTPPATSIASVTATVSASGEPFTTIYDSYPGSPAPTAAVPADHRVIVGGPGKLAYEPSNLMAQPGDTITFEFRQKNHTVTASSFDAPCRALASTSATGEIGFDSGFIAVGATARAFPTYTIEVNDTKPIWAYCRQGNHCGQGMVFAVNAIESGPNNFEAFKANAIQLNGTTTPPPPPNNAAAMGTHYTRSGALLACIGLLWLYF